MTEHVGPEPNEQATNSSLSKELEGIVRTGRDLETYKKVFGAELGKGEELILDVGAGDSSTAQEIAALTGYRAKVVRLDADYGTTPPANGELAVAADATKMPFQDASFDRITSLWMLPHLGPEKGSEVMSEVMRVLKPEGEALLFPARPFKDIETEVAQRERFASFQNEPWPTLDIIKPSDYDSWTEDRKHEVAEELTSYVTYGGPAFKLLKWGMARAIDVAGTKRSLDQGSERAISVFKRKQQAPPDD